MAQSTTVGPFTSDGVSLTNLYRRRDALLAEYAAQIDLKSELCESTWQPTLDVEQSAKTFKKAPSDTSLAPVEHLDIQTITIPQPVKYHLAGAVTQDAIKKGMTAAQVMREITSIIDADRRLVAQLIMKELLTDGGFWDATAAPPRYGNNDLTSSHDHYYPSSASGVMSLTIAAHMKRLLTEHGSEGELILMVNGDQIEKMEVQAEWVSAVADKTPLLNALQINGFTPQFKTDGVTWIQNDYCPTYYGVMLRVVPNFKPLAWRFAVRPDDNDDRLLSYVTAPDEAFARREAYVRWGAVKVQRRSVGVAVDLAHGVWSDPSVTEWDAI
jgi:hypothetical protein